MLAYNKILITISLFFSYSYCKDFITENVLMISDKSIGDRYFGYSLLLQKGDVPTVIVGAPKDKIINNIHNGGQVYQCNVDQVTHCIPIINNNNTFSLLNNTNGDFLGGALDGEDHIDGALVACASKASVQQNDTRYGPGICFYRTAKLNSGETYSTANVSKFSNSRNSRWAPGGHYYDYGYASFGFDISFHNKDTVLFGAPGQKNGNGVTFSLSLMIRKVDVNGEDIVKMLPNQKLVRNKENNYFGYSVASTKFPQFDNSVGFVAGEPRGNNLTGKVTIYRYEANADDDTNILAWFQDGEVGSYFGGSVLAVDVSNDKIIDILVGAPSSAGNTYDEGCVYFYKDSKNSSRVKLTGSSKIGSRFGTAMVSLGDFDLDGYNDVAISAPYESNGVGAVYIYRGSMEGLKNEYSQRLVPSDVSSGIDVKGFGLGISKGNDIDKNGHNDFAIGAYKTSQVFIVKSYSIIDYQVFLTRDIDGLYKNTTNFEAKLCLNYTKRSKTLVLTEVKFYVFISLDYRSKNTRIDRTVSVRLGETKCVSHNIPLLQNLKDVSPFQIEAKIKVLHKSETIKANGKTNIKLLTPYILGCVNSICITGLTIELQSNRKTIIVGEHKRFELEILVNNDGEPAYMCEVLITVPAGVQLRNLRDCVQKSRDYTCPVIDKLDQWSSKKEKFVFDVNSLELTSNNIKLLVSLTSIGKNKNDYKDKDVLNISVIESSTTYITGTSEPESIELKGGTLVINNNEVNYEFTIGKLGPSPVELNVDILLPEVTYDGVNIFQVERVKGMIDNKQVICRQTVQRDVNWDDILGQLNVERIPPNRTIMVHCKDFACSQFSCSGEYLYTPDQIAIFQVKIEVKSKDLISKFIKELRSSNLIAYIPVILQRNSKNIDDEISNTTPLLIFVENVKSIPLWAYLVAALVGTILIVMMVFGLYKCNFFKRTYKDKLDRQQLVNGTENEEEDSMKPTYRMSELENNEDAHYENY